MRTYTIILHAGIKLTVKAASYMTAKLNAMREHKVALQAIKQVV